MLGSRVTHPASVTTPSRTFNAGLTAPPDVNGLQRTTVVGAGVCGALSTAATAKSPAHRINAP